MIVCPDELPPVAAASMWTRKDVKEFKDSLKNDHESVLKVGSGEIVTVCALSIQSSLLFRLCAFYLPVHILFLPTPSCAFCPQPQCSWHACDVRSSNQH